MIAPLQTCRFCGNSQFERNHPAGRSHIFRYGPRHSAHLKCFAEKKGIDATRAAIGKLSKSQLAVLPFMELQDLGLLNTARVALEAAQ